MKRTMQPPSNILSSPAGATSFSSLGLHLTSLALGLPIGSKDDRLFTSYSCERHDQLIHWNHPEVNFL
jgi:hypothetical protein